MILRLSAILFFACSTGLPAAVDCSYFPGSLLCGEIRDVSTWMNYTCKGDACYSLWQRQLNALRLFIRDYDRNIPYGTLGSQEIGSVAHTAARGICRASSTGNCDWMKALFYARTGALSRLVELQNNSDIPSTLNCQLSYKCN